MTDLEVSSIQVIDENKVFNSHLADYMKQFYSQNNSNDEKGLNYHIVSVFGSQSTGKSTLLNHLFHTKFDIMDESQRQQTTKGIWLAHANHIANSSEDGEFANNTKNIFVMDVEGTDGRERGEDQDFERKAALFALSTSEILIINIWEHQVGLYQGANMGLLRTVFEVNLSLFAKNKQRCLLLFVIRDHVGNTSLESLSDVLTLDLQNIWSQLSKPEGTEGFELDDFFDLKFVALAHKLLQPDKFVEDISVLGDKFISDDQLFNEGYHRAIPIDGWSMYAEQVWEQIETNQDLDLPTQQILVARFRCDEISSQVYESFHEQFVKSNWEDLSFAELGNLLKELRQNTAQQYDVLAGRYTESVYLQRKKLLVQKVDLSILEVYNSVLQKLIKQSKDLYLKEIESALIKKEAGVVFSQVLDNAERESLKYFSENTALISFVDIDDSEAKSYDPSPRLGELEEELSILRTELVNKEQENIKTRIPKKFKSQFKFIVQDELSNIKPSSWEELLDQFRQVSDKQLAKYKSSDSYDFHLGLSKEKNKELLDQVLIKFWIKFKEILNNFVTETNVLRLLVSKFEDEFRYDEEGLPVVWKNSSEIDVKFAKARNSALDMLPLFSLAHTAEGEILPDFDIAHDETEADSDNGEDDGFRESHKFAHLLSARDQDAIRHKFKKQTDALYVETKRSVINSKTEVPLYIYALLLVLGWNEFMIVLRNPLLITLLLIGLTGLYLGYKTNLLGPIIQVVQAMVQELQDQAKNKLRDVLAPEPEAPSQVRIGKEVDVTKDEDES
ncbi:BA75_00294T0 [Komagataella pastoris]|uniref:BA75_00294T0 n=1 Tax=Komagataella pastoris TaxID=4922 RepID=A0A1B2J853_PICPA|nr:BA75_00294T0 [Komagataella pastoris]